MTDVKRNEPINIGSGRQLFVDHFLIDSLQGASLRLHRPVRREPAIAIEHPWEERGVSYMVTFKDGDKYRAWYRCDGGPRATSVPITAYAESEDGIVWIKPRLGVCEFQGSTDNNICIADPMVCNTAPFKDLNPETPESERYKAIARHRKNGIFTLASPDGLRWKRLQEDEEPVFTGAHGPFDSHNIGFHDPWTGQYLMYTRGRRTEGRLGHGMTSAFAKGVRWIRRAVSEDFVNWSEPEPIDAGETPLEHLYTNACVPYERSESLYLMFPSRFVDSRSPTPDWPHAGLNDAVFMSSRDGVHFDRTFMEAFLRPGTDSKNWHDRSVYIERGILHTSQEEMSMFTMENWRMPSNCIRRITLRTDGFVSVNAPYGGGELLTTPLVFDGAELRVNVSTSAAGSIRVEIQDEGGRPFPGLSLEDCREIFADNIDLPVRWKSDARPGPVAGKAVRLRFVMYDADLYAFRFTK